MSTRTNQVKKISYISKKTSSRKQKSTSRNDGNRVFTGCYGFKLPKLSELSPLNFLKHFRRKIAYTLCLWRRSSSEISSSGRSKSFIAATDTHRSKAIEDCIEFINSSSSASASLPRSNSS